MSNNALIDLVKEKLPTNSVMVALAERNLSKTMVVRDYIKTPDKFVDPNLAKTIVDAFNSNIEVMGLDLAIPITEPLYVLTLLLNIPDMRELLYHYGTDVDEVFSSKEVQLGEFIPKLNKIIGVLTFAILFEHKFLLGQKLTHAEYYTTIEMLSAHMLYTNKQDGKSHFMFLMENLDAFQEGRIVVDTTNKFTYKVLE